MADSLVRQILIYFLGSALIARVLLVEVKTRALMRLGAWVFFMVGLAAT